MNYENKYYKYKVKYLDLKNDIYNQSGAAKFKIKDNKKKVLVDGKRYARILEVHESARGDETEYTIEYVDVDPKIIETKVKKSRIINYE